MRPLHAILRPLAFITLAAVSGCASNISGTGGSSSSSSSTATDHNTTGTGTGTGSTSSSSSCMPMGQSCAGTGYCCGDGECIGGICQPCMDGIGVSQCMCGDTPVGPASQSACTVGEACGLDAGLSDGGDGGACQCVQMVMLTPCP